MNDYHLAWLSVHPNRTEEWLAEKLQDGFGIHHIDGDHSNNDPDNLVLLDWTDHRMLHNGGRRRLVAIVNKHRNPIKPHFNPVMVMAGEPIYKKRTEGAKWESIAKSKRIAKGTAIELARQYAFFNAMIWPIPTPPRTTGRRTKPGYRRPKRSRPWT